jgi:hypothetical protein
VGHAIGDGDDTIAFGQNVAVGDNFSGFGVEDVSVREEDSVGRVVS